MDDRRQQADRRASDRKGGRRTTDIQPEWISVGLFARLYGVDRRTVRKWLACELLDVYRVGPLIRIRNLPPDEHTRMASRS